MRIAVDAFGGDNAPAAVVEGCIDALKKYPDMSVTLCGDEKRIKAELEKYRYDVGRVDILHAPEIISCDEQPTFAIRKKKDSSLVKAMELVRFRKGYASQDIQRTKVQQEFLRALAKKVLSVSSLTKLKGFADVFSTYVTTDLTVGNMLYFAQALMKCDFDAMKTYTLEGEGAMINGGSYYPLYAGKLVQVVNESFNPYDAPVTLDTVNVITPDLARSYQKQTAPEPEEPENPEEQTPENPDEEAPEDPDEEAPEDPDAENPDNAENPDETPPENPEDTQPGEAEIPEDNWLGEGNLWQNEQQTAQMP